MYYAAPKSNIINYTLITSWQCYKFTSISFYRVVVKSIYNTGQDPDCCENCAKAKDFIINIMGVAVPSFTHVVRYIAYPQQQ